MPSALAAPTSSPEDALHAVEVQLTALSQALTGQDAQATEQAAAALHLALSVALRRLGTARSGSPLPTALRRRLALVTGQVAAQREAVARASAALDRAIDILLPTPATRGPAAIYGAHGGAVRSNSTGFVQA
jgi:hypothetical protein